MTQLLTEGRGLKTARTQTHTGAVSCTVAVSFASFALTETSQLWSELQARFIMFFLSTRIYLLQYFGVPDVAKPCVTEQRVASWWKVSQGCHNVLSYCVLIREYRPNLVNLCFSSRPCPTKRLSVFSQRILDLL